MNREVEEVTQHTHETWRWRWGEQGTNLSHSVRALSVRTVKEQRHQLTTKERIRKRRIYNAWRLMHWHQLRSRSRVPQVFQVTSHIVGFRSVLRVVNWILVAVTIYSILTCTRIPCRVHTSKMVFWGVVFTRSVGCSRPPSAVNDPIVTK